VQPAVPQPALVDTRAFGLVLPGYPVVFDTAFQRVAADRWILPIEFAQVGRCFCSILSRFFFLTISAPQSLRDVTLFLNTPLPDPSVSLSIFFALPPFADFRFIGSVNNVSPSASVRLRLQPGDGQPTALQIAVLMEATATTEQRNAQLQARAHSSQHFFFSCADV
jgi:hypothetical protein